MLFNDVLGRCFEIEITLEEVKTALKIDYDDEDTFLNLCIEVAKSHLESAIDDYDTKNTDEKFANKAKLIIILTVQDLFDNRSFTTNTTNGQSEKVKYIIQSLLIQMRWS